MSHLEIMDTNAETLQLVRSTAVARPLCLRLRGRRSARPLNHRAKNRRQSGH
jgi:hypothetical protein